MGTTPMEMYKLFFGPQVACPELNEDAGLSCNRQDTRVSSLVFGRTICLLFIIRFLTRYPPTGVDSASKADKVSGPPPRDRAGARAGQNVGGRAFRRRRRGK